MRDSNGEAAVGESPKEPRTSKKIRSLFRRVELALIAVILIFFASGFFAPIIDDHTLESRKCIVDRAEATTQSSGIKMWSTSPVVKIYTKDCGIFNFSKKVTFDNSDEVAATFKPGKSYVFYTGGYTRFVHDLFRHDNIQVERVEQVS